MDVAAVIVAQPGKVVDIQSTDNHIYPGCRVTKVDETGIGVLQHGERPIFFGWRGIVKIVEPERR